MEIRRRREEWAETQSKKREENHQKKLTTIISHLVLGQIRDRGCFCGRFSSGYLFTRSAVPCTTPPIKKIALVGSIADSRIQKKKNQSIQNESSIFYSTQARLYVYGAAMQGYGEMCAAPLLPRRTSSHISTRSNRFLLVRCLQHPS